MQVKENMIFCQKEAQCGLNETSSVFTHTHTQYKIFQKQCIQVLHLCFKRILQKKKKKRESFKGQTLSQTLTIQRSKTKTCLTFSCNLFSWKKLLIWDFNAIIPVLVSESKLSIKKKKKSNTVKTESETRLNYTSSSQLDEKMLELICNKRTIRFFWPCHVACGISVPRPGTGPGPGQ